MRAKRRMPPALFEAVRPLLKISQDRIEAARLALVDGLTLQAVGDRYGWSRQAVGDAVGIVWGVKERYDLAQQAGAAAGGELPPGWERATLEAPKALMARFRAEIAASAALPPAPKGGSKPRTKTKKGNA